MKSKLIVCLILAALVVPFSLWGEEEEKGSDFYFQLAKVRWYLLWGIDFLPTGADFTVGYKGLSIFPGVETKFQITAGGGYDSLNLYRDTDGTPSLPGSLDPEWEFNSILLEWEPGIRQGIVWSDRLQRNLLEGFLFYRGHLDFYMNGRVIWEGYLEGDTLRTPFASEFGKNILQMSPVNRPVRLIRLSWRPK